MTKADLITVVAEKTDMTKADATKAVEAVIDEITNALANGEEVQIAGFGKFVVRNRVGREGKDPRTGEKIFIADTKTPAFVAGKALKEAVKK